MSHLAHYTLQTVKDSVRLYFEPLVLLYTWLRTSVFALVNYVVSRAINQSLPLNPAAVNSIIKHWTGAVDYRKKGKKEAPSSGVYQYATTFQIQKDLPLHDLEQIIGNYLTTLHKIKAVVIDSNLESLTRERRTFKQQTEFVTLIFHAANTSIEDLKSIKYVNSKVAGFDTAVLREVDKKELNSLTVELIIKASSIGRFQKHRSDN